jgi:alkylhydroperoxidase family enzyme
MIQIFVLAAVTFNSVPLPSDAQLRQSVVKKLKRALPLNIYRMMANIPCCFPEYMDYIHALFQTGSLPPRLREVSFLREAYLLQSDYEWHQHSFLAEALGMSKEEIETIRLENPVTSLSDDENFVCKVTDEITQNARLCDDTFHEIFNRYSIEEGTELILIASFANMLGRFVNATRVPIESGNVLKGLSIPN